LIAALALKQNVISGTNLLNVSFLGTGIISNTVLGLFEWTNR
jgi:hypothetical protein